jgi:hypothetical protein
VIRGRARDEQREKYSTSDATGGETDHVALLSMAGVAPRDHPLQKDEILRFAG